jgi:diaminopimelate epimerase
MKRLIPFEKYEATGNDFIILDFFEFTLFDLADTDFIKLLCDRHFGIGADGLIALQYENGFDFRMNYFNSDGRKSTFCGNGSRASIQYMASKHKKSDFSFIAQDGPHYGKVNDGLVSVKMKNIDSYQETPNGILIDSGSPHLIVEVKKPWEYPINEEGRRLRNLFGPDGVNVNFIEKSAKGLTIATYERGVEWETLACGTGVTAAAYYKCLSDKQSGSLFIEVDSKGGALHVNLNIHDKSATEIWLTGRARKVFSGFYEFE